MIIILFPHSPSASPCQPTNSLMWTWDEINAVCFRNKGWTLTSSDIIGQMRWSVASLTRTLPAAVVLLGGAHQFAVEVLLPVLGEPHVPPVVLQSPWCEVRIEAWKTTKRATEQKTVYSSGFSNHKQAGAECEDVFICSALLLYKTVHLLRKDFGLLASGQMTQ